MSSKSCTYCNAVGHYKPKCTVRMADLERAAAIQKSTAERTAALPPFKHPGHWELLAAKRALVQAQLLGALASLSSSAPAAKHIKQAIKLLEDVR